MLTFPGVNLNGCVIIRDYVTRRDAVICVQNSYTISPTSRLSAGGLSECGSPLSSVNCSRGLTLFWSHMHCPASCSQPCLPRSSQPKVRDSGTTTHHKEDNPRPRVNWEQLDFLNIKSFIQMEPYGGWHLFHLCITKALKDSSLS